MTVGEAWTSTQNIAPYSDHRLDYCFEFDLAYAIINTVNNRNASGLRNKVNEINSAYEAGQFGSFLTNHDQDRSFSQFGQNTSKAKLAASILLSLPGVPYLYYGEEVGMIGLKPDENIRKPMQWSTENQAGFTTGQSWQTPNLNFAEANVADQLLDDNSLLKHYQKWIGLRTNYPALRTGTYQDVAQKVGVTNPLISYRFENKEDLWKKSMSYLGDKLVDRFEHIKSYYVDLSGTMALRAYTRQYIYFLAENPALYKIIFQEMGQENWRSTFLIEQLFTPVIWFGEKSIEAPLEGLKEFKTIPRANFISIIMGASSSLFMLAHLMKNQYGTEVFSQEQIEQHAEVVNNIIFKQFEE